MSAEPTNFWNSHTAGELGLDHLLYFDEDNDLEAEQMADFTVVEAAHIIELIERGHLREGETFSHRGFHHVLRRNGTSWRGSVWDGPTGDEHYYRADWNEWGD